MSLSKEPALTPIRIGMFALKHSLATSFICFSFLIFPGFSLKPCTPASTAARANLYWKWISATIGPRDVENKSVVFSRRDGVDGKFDINFDDINTKVTETLDDVHKNLLNLSRNFREENTVHVDSYEELISALNGEPGFVTCFWNENSDDENKVKAETKATLRCYVLNEEKTDKAVNNENEQGKLAIFSKAY